MEKQVKEKSVKQPKEKKPLSKKAKIWISLGTAFVFVASAIAVVLALVLSPRALNLHGLRVANFENYTGIGAASFDNGKKTTAVAYASGGSAGKKDMNLAGITKDNKCQKIEFENEMGKITKQNARLIHFDAYDKFTLFTLTTNKKYEFVESGNQYNNGGYSYRYFSENFALKNEYYEYKDTSTLILDNETGKIYDMKEIVGVVQKFVNNKFGFEISFFNFDVNQMNNSVNIEPVGQKSLLMKVFDYSNNTNINKISIFEAKLTENGVEVKQRMNSIQFDNFTNRSEWDQYASEVKVSQDIYGNIFVKQNYTSSYAKFQKTDGTFAILDGSGATYTLGINSVMYKKTADKTFYMNAKGEFEEIDFNTEIISAEKKFHYKKGNVIVCGDFDGGSTFYKVTLDSNIPWKYSFESYSMMGASTTTCAQGNFVYSLNIIGGTLSKFDMQTRTTNQIGSQYTFKNLAYNKNLDRVTFKAVDTSTYNEVDGYFDESGEIHIGDFNSVNYGENKVYIIKPIN